MCCAMQGLQSRAVGLLALALVAGPATAADFEVKEITIPELKAVFGQIESRTVVPARARIGGTVTEILVDEGREVRDGEVIARVVDDKIALELSAAEARIRALESQLDNASTELERAQQLLGRGVTTQSRVDQAQTTFDVITNQIAAAIADRSVIEQRSREGDVLAPATGRVLSVPVTQGSVVLPGEPIARIATGRYFLRLSLPERHAAAIVEGDEVMIGRRGLAANQSGRLAAATPGRIVKVYPEIADGRVIADVDVADIGDYFVGERTLVSIPIGRRRVLAVPAAAVVTRHGVDYVALRAEKGIAEVAVILGERFEGKDGPMVEILTGLEAGDRIILP